MFDIKHYICINKQFNLFYESSMKVFKPCSPTLKIRKVTKMFIYMNKYNYFNIYQFANSQCLHGFVLSF